MTTPTCPRHPSTPFLATSERLCLTLTLPYPVSVNSIARAVNGHVIVSKRARDYKKECGWIARQAYRHDAPFLGRVSLSVTLHPRRNKDGQGSGICQDLSNVLKVAEDALKGIIFADDKQVDFIQIRRGDPVAGGSLVISIEEL